MNRIEGSSHERVRRTVLAMAHPRASGLGDVQQRVVAADRIPRSDPGGQRADGCAAQAMYGYTLFKQGQTAEALTQLDAAFYGAPTSMFIALTYAVVLAELTDYDQSPVFLAKTLNVCRRAVELADEQGSAQERDLARLELAGALLDLDSPEAEAIYRDLHARHPKQPEYLYGLGLVHRKRGEWAHVKSTVSRALALEWKYADAHCLLAKALVVLNEWADADRHFELAIRFGSTNPVDELCGRALCNWRLGRAEAARELLKSALAIDASDEAVVRLQAEMAQAAVQPTQPGGPQQMGS